MDFLGIGPLELIVVLIIALIVVGPERLPQLAQSVGKTLRDLRAMSQGLAAEWQREMSSVTQEISSVTEMDPGEDLKQTLAQPFKEAQAEFEQTVKAPLTPPSETTPRLPPAEPPPAEQPDTASDDADHADT